MKRRDLVRHMIDHGCDLLREGGNHSWWGNPQLNQRSAVPRHREIPDYLAKKICRDLGIPAPGEADGEGDGKPEDAEEAP